MLSVRERRDHKHMLRIFCTWLLVGGVALAIAPCPATDNAYQAALDRAYAQPTAVPDPAIDLVDLEQSYTCFANWVLLKQADAARDAIFKRSFLDLQTAVKSITATNTQTGSSTATGGSTSLVSNGTTAQILSVASEYGALTETTSNQTVTVAGTLDGPFVAATRQYLVGYCPDEKDQKGYKPTDPYCVKKKTHDALSRFAYGVTFNASSTSQTASGTPTQSSGTTGQTMGQQSSAQQVTFTPSGRDIASITGRIVLSESRMKTTNKKFIDAWNCAFTPASTNTGNGSGGSTPDGSNSNAATPSASSSQSGSATKGGASKGGSSKGGTSKGATGSNKATSCTQDQTSAGQNQAVSIKNLQTALAVLAKQLKASLDALGLPANPTSVANLPDTDSVKPFLNYYINQWWPETLKDLKADLPPNPNASRSQLETDYYRDLEKLYTHILLIDSTLPQQAGDILRAAEEPRFEVDQLIASIADQSVWTLEYDDNRPQNQNQYSTVKLIFDKSFGSKAQWSLTANGGVSFNTVVSSSVPGSSTFRDAQFGAEGKYSFGQLSVLGSSLGNAAISATYYFQDQHSPSVLNVTPGTPLTGITLTGLSSTATQVFAATGPIHVGQIRFELGSGSSVKFPLAITYASRTELLTHPDLRAQIGISYSFDSLFTSSGQGSSSK
jgi:hypothetical protein